MSRKMIDYKVEGNKISTIDGYKVGGGDELTAGKNITISDNNIISAKGVDTANPDSEGMGGIVIQAKHYAVGDKLSVGLNLASYPDRLYIPASAPDFDVIKVDNVVFITTYTYNRSQRRMYANLICIKEGDVSTGKNQTMISTWFPIK